MSPAAIAWEAKWTACWLEPHMRLRLTAGTVTGKPASITPSRSMFAPCSPAWVTVPFMTSSTFPGSNPARSRSPSRVRARRASGRTSRKAPPAFPNGVRTASRITGSLTCVMIRLLPRRYLRVPQAPYRADDLLQGGEFVHYLVGVRGPLQASSIEVGAQDQHPHVRIGPAQIGDQVYPIPIGEPQIQDRHVELEPRHVGTGLDERSCLGYHLDVRLAVQQDLHEISEIGMILDVNYTDLLRPGFPAHPRTSPDNGTRNLTLVPRSTSLAISSSPPMSAARSRMLPNPAPGVVSGPNPRPSSDTPVSRASPSISRRTVTFFAPECLRALVSASWIMCETCVPVSPNGAEGTCSPTSRLISQPRAIVRLRLTTDSTISR